MINRAIGGALQKDKESTANILFSFSLSFFFFIFAVMGFELGAHAC
jgi:hypothetical protein